MKKLSWLLVLVSAQLGAMEKNFADDFVAVGQACVTDAVYAVDDADAADAWYVVKHAEEIEDAQAKSCAVTPVAAESGAIPTIVVPAVERGGVAVAQREAQPAEIVPVPVAQVVAEHPAGRQVHVLGTGRVLRERKPADVVKREMRLSKCDARSQQGKR